MIGNIVERAKIRLPEAENDILVEFAITVTDRIKLRAGVSDFPPELYSVAVEATVKAYRRIYYEGISTETTEGMSTSFVDDILAEFSEEIQAVKNKQSRIVKFL